jgi:tol-pal system protein YbgF
MKNFWFISILVGLSVISLPTTAEEGDIIGKAIRMDQMERRLMLLEQKLFSGTAKEVTARSSSRPVDVSGDVRMMLADFEARVQQLEEEWRKMYGAVEELGHSVDKMAEKVELITKDLDFRLQDLESDAVKTAKKEAEKKGPVALADGNIKDKEDIPEDMNAEKLYQKAYQYLTATSYDKAEVWFKEFIKRHPDNKLADNAYYWLGEVYLVQGMAEKAVVEFSNGLGAFPNGTKAPANLLKMGVAFTQMDREDHAKSAWSKLLRDFPNTPEAAKARTKLDDAG